MAGNHAFGKGDYTEALKYYQLALTTCPSILSTSTTSVSDDDQGYNDNDNGEESKEELSIHSSTTTDTKINVVAAAKYRTERAVYHANMAACHIKLKEYQLAIEGCSAALELDPSYTRALQRKAQAEELLGTFASMNQAKEDHLKVVETLKIELGLIAPPKEEKQKGTTSAAEEASSTSPSTDTGSPTPESSSPASKRPQRPQPAHVLQKEQKPTYEPIKLDLDEASKKKHRMLLQSSEQALKRMEPILKEMLEKEKAEMMGKPYQLCHGMPERTFM